MCFHVLLAIFISSLEKCLLFMLSAHFLSGLFLLRLLSVMSCLQILETNPLLVASFANTFPRSVGCFSILFIVCFAVQKLLSRPYLVIFVFISTILDDGSKKMLLHFMSECFAYVFLQEFYSVQSHV